MGRVAASADQADVGVGRLLKQAEQTMLRVKGAALKPLGLTLAQYLALTELERQPGITGASLARASLVSPQAMMVVLKSLEDQGLVSRTPHTRHANVLEVRVTDAGGEALAGAREVVEPIEHAVLDVFSPAELDVFGDLLARWTKAFGDA
jgi:DNA-binding MarR family transcriptional regulator